jgi:hypothetical protein
VTRSGFNGLIGGVLSASSLKSRGGVVFGQGGSLAVTQNGTPNMSVNVASGTAYIPGTEGSKQGTYVVLNDATLNVTIATSDPTNARIDLIVYKVQDAFYSGAVNSSSIVAVTGTPAGSPSPPAAPANSIILAHVNVAANDTSITTGEIVDKRPFAAALGGAIPYTTGNGPATSTLSAGQLLYNISTNTWEVWNGTAQVNFYTSLNGPRGLIARGNRTTNGTGTTSEVGVLRVDSVALTGGRAYSLRAKCNVSGTADGDAASVKIRVNTGGVATTSSTIVSGSGAQDQTGPFVGSTIQAQAVYLPAGNETASFLVCFTKVGGTGTTTPIVDTSQGITTDLFVEDIGLAVSDTGVDI